MLTFNRSRDWYAISYLPRHRGASMQYKFNASFLPASTMLHARSLGIFVNAEVTIKLNANQDGAVVEIMQKLNHETRSKYIFSEYLQKIYLVELFHLLTKMKQGI